MRNGALKSVKKEHKNRPQHNQPQLRLPGALRGRGPAVSGENAGEVVVVGVVCHMWPRTKRNVVEAKDVVKDVGRAVLGFPKEVQGPPKNNERGWGFLILAMSCVPFLGPIKGTFVLTVVGSILGIIFVFFVSFVRSWASLGRSSVFLRTSHAKC